jgi:hypothetical protein
VLQEFYVKHNIGQAKSVEKSMQDHEEEKHDPNTYYIQINQPNTDRKDTEGPLLDKLSNNEDGKVKKDDPNTKSISNLNPGVIIEKYKIGNEPLKTISTFRIINNEEFETTAIEGDSGIDVDDVDLEFHADLSKGVKEEPNDKAKEKKELVHRPNKSIFDKLLSTFEEKYIYEEFVRFHWLIFKFRIL